MLVVLVETAMSALPVTDGAALVLIRHRSLVCLSLLANMQPLSHCLSAHSVIAFASEYILSCHLVSFGLRTVVSCQNNHHSRRCLARANANASLLHIVPSLIY